MTDKRQDAIDGKTTDKRQETIDGTATKLENHRSGTEAIEETN